MSAEAGRHERKPLGSLAGLDSSDWSPWPLPLMLATTPSTMTEVEHRAAAGAPEGLAVVAEEQTEGRGRRGRTWESAPRAGLWWSLLLRPDVAPSSLGWLPLVVGVGVAEAIRDNAGVEARVKWPNDIVVGSPPLKLAGGLAERLGDGSVVVGVGINVDHAAEELPEAAASLRSLGCQVDRTGLLVAVLSSVARAYRDWLAGSDPAAAYAELSATLGSEVSVDLGDHVVTGVATGLGPSGELVVSARDSEVHVVSAGDVTLLRPAP